MPDRPGPGGDSHPQCLTAAQVPTFGGLAHIQRHLNQSAIPFKHRVVLIVGQFAAKSDGTAHYLVTVSSDCQLVIFQFSGWIGHQLWPCLSLKGNLDDHCSAALPSAGGLAGQPEHIFAGFRQIKVKHVIDEMIPLFHHTPPINRRYRSVPRFQ